MMLGAGQILQGRYRVLHVLGAGGFSTVYLAEDTRLAPRRVAVKMMHLDAVFPREREWAAQQFWQEAQLLAQLRHEGIDDEVVMREQITLTGNYTFWDPAAVFRGECYGYR